jgi:hypothetical protein
MPELEPFPPNVTLDVTTITLGEMSEIEIQSGVSFERLLRGKISRQMVALWVYARRTFEQPRTWQELSNLRLYDVASSSSPKPSGGHPRKSKGSRSET